jgi:hypothetical protein
MLEKLFKLRLMLLLLKVELLPNLELLSLQGEKILLQQLMLLIQQHPLQLMTLLKLLLMLQLVQE